MSVSYQAHSSAQARIGFADPGCYRKPPAGELPGSQHAEFLHEVRLAVLDA